jgi:predicted lipoprotein with Yx(FWY)xxD motif
MSRKKPVSLIIAVVLVPLVALVVAGCGDGGGDATAASSSMTAGGGSGTIRVSDNSSLGKLLVDSKGRTVYLFQKDTGAMSTCSGACASEWPPVTTGGKPTAGDGVTASMLATTMRSDGSRQVTYNGHPLYLYAGDQNPGDTAGQGLNFFGGLWYAGSPSGNPITKSSGSGSSSKSYSY